MNEIEITKRRLLDCAERSLSQSTWEFSKFLNIAEISEMQKMKFPVKASLYGGYDGAERCIAVLGSLDDIGYEPIYPVSFVSVSPLNEKFSDTLSHRDVLGALMSLGINRNMLGDILLSDNSAVIVCIDSVAGFIVSSLNKIKHTDVKCKTIDCIPDIALPKPLYCEVLSSSERIDCVISGVYCLSRNQSQALVKAEKVFADGIAVKSTSLVLKPCQIISVRGFGRFVYKSALRSTKKGRLVIAVDKY